MSVSSFLQNPEAYRVRLDDQRYRIAERLMESGDPPGVASYLLEQESPGANYRVLKVPVWNSDRSSACSESGRLLDPERRLNETKGQVAEKKREAIHLARITGSGGSVPTVPRIYLPQEVLCVSKEGVETDITEYVIVREHIRGVLLSDWMVAYEATRPCPAKSFAGIRDVNEWFQLARMLVKALEPIHNERLVHGDLRPRNVILEGLTLVGLKISELEELKKLNPEHLRIDKAKVRLLDTEENGPESFPASNIKDTGTFRRKYDSPQRVFIKKEEEGPFEARRNSARWFAPTDMFSLGIILFKLACGWEPPFGPFLVERLIEESDLPNSTCPTWFQIGSYEVRKTNRQLKAELLEAWKKSQGARLGIETAQITDDQWTEGKEAIIRMSEVILGCLRSHTDAQLGDLKALEGIIDEFDPALKSKKGFENVLAQEPKGDATNAIHLSLRDTLDDYLKLRAALLPRVVKELMSRRSHRLLDPLDSLVGNEQLWFFPIIGRAAMVDNMVTLIGQLSPEDKCRALLTPNFFFKENMGLIGRVTSSLQLAAFAGVEINWILLVNEEQLKSREVAEVLQHQKSAGMFLRGSNRAKVKEYGVHYVVVDKQEYSNLFHKRRTAILISNERRKEKILVAPDYHGEDGRMSALRIWPRPDTDRWDELDEVFEQHERSKLSITAFNR